MTAKKTAAQRNQLLRQFFVTQALVRLIALIINYFTILLKPSCNTKYFSLQYHEADEFELQIHEEQNLY